MMLGQEAGNDRGPHHRWQWGWRHRTWGLAEGRWWEGKAQMKGLRCNFLCERWADRSPEAGQPPRAISVRSAQRLD